MNPVKQIRKRLGLTQEALSELIDIHPQAILLNEQGVYPTVLPRILDYFETQGFDRTETNLQYAEYVHLKRQEIREHLNWEGFEWKAFDTNGQHPFITFRESFGMSRMMFAKQFCVHPAYLYKLE